MQKFQFWSVNFENSYLTNYEDLGDMPCQLRKLWKSYLFHMKKWFRENVNKVTKNGKNRKVIKFLDSLDTL